MVSNANARGHDAWFLPFPLPREVLEHFNLEIPDGEEATEEEEEIRQV